MTGGMDVKPEVLREAVRLLTVRASSVSRHPSVGARPDVGESSGELGLLFTQVEDVTGALAERVRALADAVDASLCRYLDADDRAHGRLDDLVVWGRQ
ncbi:MAG: hypothetical protein ACRDYU_04570 [Actinomycetes bacterium]